MEGLQRRASPVVPLEASMGRSIVAIAIVVAAAAGRRVMRHARLSWRAFGCIATACAVLAGCAVERRPAPEVAEEPEVATPQERHDAFAAALAARDADAVAAHFAEDAVMHLAGRPPIHGRSAIRSLYAGMFDFLESSRLEAEAVHVASAGDMAFAHGETANRFRGPQGEVTEYAGKYSLVWRRHDDEWLLVLYSVSSNEPEGGG
jgi:uncharacterized protein (TIGR02246 family)